jgi:hypothetical protein
MTKRDRRRRRAWRDRDHSWIGEFFEAVLDALIWW